MGHLQKKMLYELIPDIFPEGILTEVEAALWVKFHQSLKNK